VAPPPEKPGVSVQLRYPVLLVSAHKFAVKDDEASLTTTTVASGLNFPEFAVIDSQGAKYSVTKVTDFGRKSTILDMGTTPYRVFLEMKSAGQAGLSDAQALVESAMADPNADPATAQVAQRTIRSTKSVAELIERCHNSWDWN
jgi:hypothetical protein